MYYEVFPNTFSFKKVQNLTEIKRHLNSNG